MENITTKEKFRQRLIQLMNERNVTAARLADHIGIPRSRISKMTTGVTGPALDTALELSKYFGVSVEYMAGVRDTYFYDPDAEEQIKQLQVRKEQLCSEKERLQKDYNQLKEQMEQQLLDYKQLSNQLDNQMKDLLMTFNQLNKKNPHEYEMIQKLKLISEKMYESKDMQQNTKLVFEITGLMEILETRNLEEKTLLDELRSQLPTLD